MASPQHDLMEHTIPPGSSLYYSLRYAPRSLQPALRALFAYQREITKIPREVREPSVAQAKLGWWREELGRAYAGQAQHPIAQALARDLLSGRDIERQRLLEVIEGVQLDLDYGLYPSFRELSDYCHRIGGSITELAVELCGYQHPDTRLYAHDLGIALRLFTLLRNVRPNLEAGRLYIPEDEMEQAGVSLAELQGHRSTPAIQALFALQAARVRDFFLSALQRLPEADRRRQRSGVVLAHLYLTLLTEMEAAGYPLLERRLHLTPINKFWIAWRAARRQRAWRNPVP